MRKKVYKKYVILNSFQDLISERPCDPEINSGRPRFAFTLSEVLITLGIIGVVAALTVPTLIANNQKKQYVTQLKQVYSQLSEAMKLLMVDEGVNKVSDTNILTWDYIEDDDIFWNRVGENFFKKYFKVIKDCGRENPSSCFAPEYTNISKNDTQVPWCYYSVIVSSGASICISGRAMGGGPGTIVVDVNGPKKPNIGGRDLFSFSYYYDGSIDEGVTPECRKGGECQVGYSYYTSAKETREDRFDLYCKGTSNGSMYGVGCFGKILNDGWKMDY